ncbi:hypothetical protein SUDANB66_00352 [Streptomyces sp. SudanB66_2053]
MPLGSRRGRGDRPAPGRAAWSERHARRAPRPRPRPDATEFRQVTA